MKAYNHIPGAMGRPSRHAIFLSIFLFTSVFFPRPILSQQDDKDIRDGALNVFLECATRGCESSHFRTEITYVNWVRQMEDAQAHIIMTSSSTGSGDEYIIDFLGRGEFEGIDDQLTYAHSDAETEDARVRGLTGVLSIGIARYAVLLGQHGPFTVHAPPEGSPNHDLPPGQQGEVDDPWDYWVFRVGGDSSFEEEDLESEREYSGSFSANRTTEEWKISLAGEGSYTDSNGEYSDGTPYSDIRQEGSLEARAFYSLSDRWSWGIEAGTGTSTSTNQDLSGRVGTGVEYSFFPYEDWTSRRMTAEALLYGRYFDYEEITQFNKTSETVVEGSFIWALGFRQPWGTAYLNATAEAYLHDPSTFYRLSFGGRLSIRIARGLDWNIGGSISRIRDQLYIPMEDLSDEDVLLGRLELPTDSRLSINTGFSFTFGSIFNNVVNNRFGSLR